MKSLKISRATGSPRQYINLLLVGDESEEMIDRYIDDSTLYVGCVDDEAVAVCAVVELPGGDVEIKNLAVDSAWRRRGFGAAMLRHVEREFAGRALVLGTGETPSTLRFYHSLGFVYSHRIPGFFTQNYPHPIIEEGHLLTDMIYLRKEV